MDNRCIVKRLNLIAVYCLGAYLIIYPLVLLVVAPFPEDKDARALAKLNQLYLSVKMYQDDHQGKSPNEVRELRPYAGDTSDLERIRLSPTAAGVLSILAYTATPIAEAKSWKTTLSPVGRIRGWPDDYVPSRRAVLFSDGQVRIMSETEFTARMAGDK